MPFVRMMFLFFFAELFFTPFARDPFYPLPPSSRPHVCQCVEMYFSVELIYHFSTVRMCSGCWRLMVGDTRDDWWNSSGIKNLHNFFAGFGLLCLCCYGFAHGFCLWHVNFIRIGNLMRNDFRGETFSQIEELSTFTFIWCHQMHTRIFYDDITFSVIWLSGDEAHSHVKDVIPHSAPTIQVNCDE